MAIFEPMVAIDRLTGALVLSGSGVIYAEEDTARTTPLVVTDPSGVAYPGGLVPVAGGKVASFDTGPEGPARALWASDDNEVFVWSPSALEASAGAAADAAATSASAAQDSADAAAASASLVGAPSDTTVATLVQSPTSQTRAAIVELAGAGGGSAGVDLSSDQDIDGTKNFLQAPMVPDDAFALGKILGLIAKIAQLEALIDEKPTIVDTTDIDEPRPDRLHVWWIFDSPVPPNNMNDATDLWTMG